MIALAGSSQSTSNPGAQTVGTSPATFTAIKLNGLAQAGTNYLVGAAEYLVSSSTRSSVSPGFSSTWPGWIISADALQNASC
jgi:hypothetical protein